MDVGQISVFLPSVSFINEQITKMADVLLLERLEQILIDIAESEQIPQDKLLVKYLHTAGNDKSKKGLLQSMRCQAKISDGGQCTRKRKTERFCGGHENSRHFGEMSHESIEVKQKPVIRVKINSKK